MMARNLNIGIPPVPETFREVLEDILGSNISDIKNLTEEQVAKLKNFKTALDLVLGQEVEED